MCSLTILYRPLTWISCWSLYVLLLGWYDKGFRTRVWTKCQAEAHSSGAILQPHKQLHTNSGGWERKAPFVWVFSLPMSVLLWHLYEPFNNITHNFIVSPGFLSTLQIKWGQTAEKVGLKFVTFGGLGSCKHSVILCILCMTLCPYRRYVYQSNIIWRAIYNLWSRTSTETCSVGGVEISDGDPCSDL